MSKHIRGHHGLRHSRSRNRADDGRLDTVFSTFSGKSLGKSNETHLCGAVVCLTKVALFQAIRNREYDQNKGSPYNPAALATLTIRPNFCLRKIGQAALVQANAPFRCTSMIWSRSLSDIFLKLRVATSVGATLSSCVTTHPLSLRIPALLM